jgi:hypothetical protein
MRNKRDADESHSSACFIPEHAHIPHGIMMRERAGSLGNPFI